MPSAPSAIAAATSRGSTRAASRRQTRVGAPARVESISTATANDKPSSGRSGLCAVSGRPKNEKSRAPATTRKGSQAPARRASAMASPRTMRRPTRSWRDLSLAGIFEIRVPVEPVFVETKEAAGFLEVDPSVADGGLDRVAELPDEHVGIELDVVEHFAHRVALD